MDFRKFNSGATRDSSNGKLEYEWYINPLNDYSFAEYMKTKQIIWWEYRKWDNWQKWIPTSAIFPSLIRHIEILKLLYKWYKVYEYKVWEEVKLHVWDNPPELVEQKNIIQELNAIRFNTEAMKLNYLLNNHHEQKEDEWLSEQPAEQSLYDRLIKERYVIKEATDKEKITSELVRTIYSIGIPLLYNWSSIPVICVTTVLENKSFTEYIVPKEYIPEEIFVELIWCTCRSEWFYIRDIENIIYNLWQFD